MRVRVAPIPEVMVRLLAACALAALLVPASALAGTIRLSKAEYVASGNRACMERIAYSNTPDGSNPYKGKTPAQVAEALARMLPVLARERAHFRRFRPPVALEPHARRLDAVLAEHHSLWRHIQTIVAAVGRTGWTEEAAKDMRRTLDAGYSTVRSLNASAKALGLSRCRWT